MTKGGKQHEKRAEEKPDRPDPMRLNLPAGGADSHAHLDMLGKKSATPEEKLDTVYDAVVRAIACGVSHIGQVFLSSEAYQSGQHLFDVWPQVFFILGIHPEDAPRCTGQALADMRQCFAQDSRLRAVGEIGLDFHWNDHPPVIQEEAFRLQLALAKSIDRPVVIHSREAAAQSLAILEAEGFAGRPVLWHCFGGDDAVGLLDRILANGWHVSIPGPVTYPANTMLREAVARIPHDRILLETDCPYLSPQLWRGKPNEPALTGFTAQTVAECLHLDAATLWQLCGENTRRFFGLTPPASPGGSGGAS